MKKHLGMLIAVAALLAIIVGSAVPGFLLARNQAQSQYPLLSDAEYYPKGYIGYRWPVRPGMEIWTTMQDHTDMLAAVQVPEDALENMTTKALAQTALCYPLLGDMLALSTAAIGFNSVYAYSNVLQALARRPDARRELQNLAGWGDGLRPTLLHILLQAPEFGGAGFADFHPF